MIQVASTNWVSARGGMSAGSLLDRDGDRRAVEEAVGVVLGGALDQEADARLDPLSDRHPSAHGRAVLRDVDLVATAQTQPLGVSQRQLHSLPRLQELE